MQRRLINSDLKRIFLVYFFNHTNPTFVYTNVTQRRPRSSGSMRLHPQPEALHQATGGEIGVARREDREIEMVRMHGIAGLRH